MPGRFLREIYVVIRKNTLLDLKSPMGLLGEFLMPLITCSMIYVVSKYSQSEKPAEMILGKFMELLLPFYLGNVNSSSIRKFALYFINEREEHFRTYQIVLGLSKHGYIFGNLLYMYCFTSMLLTPVFFTFVYFNPQETFGFVYYFACFVVGSCNFTLAFLTFFRDPKIATEVVGMVCSISLFAYYSINLAKLTGWDYLLMLLPQPSFPLAILNGSHIPASMLLITAKLAMVVYLWREHGIIPFACCFKRFKAARPVEQLSEEIEMEMLETQARVQQENTINKPRLCLLKAIVKQYGPQYALNGVTLAINEGEILSLLGRNGAGKTTLIDILTGMQQPTSGSVQMKESVQMGVCYQHEILYGEMTVQQQVEFYIRVKNAEMSELDRVLGEVGLVEEKSKKTKDLSGGMKRRLSVAIAIIGDPQLLIFDEPTSGLDPHNRRAIWQILKQLKYRNKTLLLTTHHLDEAEILADRVCIIEKGSFLVIGSPNFIKKKFGIGYNLTVYGAENLRSEHRSIVEKHLKTVEDEQMDRHITRYTLRLKDEDKFYFIIRELQKVHGLEVTLQLNSLEQAFLAILNDPEILTGQAGVNLSNTFEQRSDVGATRPFRAMLVKNILVIKSNPIRSLVLYFLNILFVVIGIAMSNFMEQIAREHATEDIDQARMSQQKGTMKKMMLLQGYYLSVGIYVATAVYEKEKKIIDVLRVRGLQWWCYWAANLLVDYTIFVVNLLIMKLLLGDLLDIWYMCGFGVALIVFCYCCSFLFKSSEKSVKYFTVINFCTGFFVPLLNLIPNEIFKDTLLWIFRHLYPLYSLQLKFSPNVNPSSLTQPLPEPVNYYALQVGFYLIVLALIECSILKRLRRQTDERSQSRVQLQHVTKNYRSEEALKGISFSVADGQMLGLLGPNGAGKSTTFKLLTSQEQPTTGKVFLEGKLHQPYEYTFKSMGICYQDDTMWEKLSAEEILKVFGHLVGVKNIKSESEWLFDKLEMENVSRSFEYLSGGNKRKCCMAVCLIGQPRSKFLDQCSTGLDPMSRRSMVKVLSMEQQSSVVFTTHSMNEAQAICTKIAILIKGELRQLKTIKQLKDKYYPCLFVDIFFTGTSNEVRQALRTRIGIFNQRLLEEDEKKLKIEVSKQQIRLSELFGKMQQLKMQGLIRDFSVYEPNLQDVYLKITAEE